MINIQNNASFKLNFFFFQPLDDEVTVKLEPGIQDVAGRPGIELQQASGIRPPAQEQPLTLVKDHQRGSQPSPSGKSCLNIICFCCCLVFYCIFI